MYSNELVKQHLDAMHSRPVVFPRLKKYSYGILSSEYYIPYAHHLNLLLIKTRT